MKLLVVPRHTEVADNGTTEHATAVSFIFVITQKKEQIKQGDGSLVKATTGRLTRIKKETISKQFYLNFNFVNQSTFGIP